MKTLLTRMFKPRSSVIEGEQPSHEDIDLAGIEIQRSEIGPWTYHTELFQEERTMDMIPASRIGADMCFRGEIQQEGSMDVLGEVVGKIVLNGPDSVLRIDQGGSLQGEGFASNVVICGSTNATITAAHVAIHESATTRGAIVYDRIEMHGGDNDISLKRNPARPA